MEMGVGKNPNCRHPATKIMAEREPSLTKGRATCLFGCRVPDHISAPFGRCFATEYCSSREHFLEQEEEQVALNWWACWQLLLAFQALSEPPCSVAFTAALEAVQLEACWFLGGVKQQTGLVAAGSICLHSCHSESLPGLCLNSCPLLEVWLGLVLRNPDSWAVLPWPARKLPLGYYTEFWDKCRPSLAARPLKFFAQTSVTTCCHGAVSQLFLL